MRHRTIEQLEAQAAGAATMNVGLFLNAVVNFLIVAFAIFILVKQLSRFQKKQEAAAPTPSESPCIPVTPAKVVTTPVGVTFRMA